MLRLTVPELPGGHRLCLVVDEVSGAYLHEVVADAITAKDEDQVWDLLELNLGTTVQADIAKGDRVYAGLRGSILLGSTRLVGDRLQLRSLTDVMTVDYELAMVFKKALGQYLEEAPSDMELVELTPYRSFAHYGPDGVTITVRRGIESRSKAFPTADIPTVLATEAQVRAQVNKLVKELDRHGSDVGDTVPV